MSVPVFQGNEHSAEVFHGGAKFLDGVGGHVLGFGQVVAVGEVFVLEPLEAVELEVALADFGDSEPAPAITTEPSLAGRRIALFPLGPAVRVRTETLLELTKVLGG